MGIWTPQVSLEVLGISILPQSTADYCAQPPEFDFPVDTDYLSLAAPPLAYVNGAYQRFRNLIYANKWVELSQCRNAPTPVLPSDPPLGFVILRRSLRVDFTNMDHGEIFFDYGAAPDGMAQVAVRFLSGSGGGNDQALIWSEVDFPIGSTSGVAPWVGVYTSGFNFNMHGDGTWVIVDPPRSGTHPAFLSFQFGRFDVRDGFVICDLAWKPASIGTIPDPPVVEGPPSGFPDPPPSDDCSAATLASICAKLDKMSKRIDFIDGAVQHTNAALVPIAPAAIDDPVGLVDNPPTGDGSPPGKAPLVKPAKAVGAVISLTNIPDYQPSRGTDPKYWPALGHVAMLTEFGPMPSQLIKHNPMVLLPIPVQCTALGFDLAPGIQASIQWLDAPK